MHAINLTGFITAAALAISLAPFQLLAADEPTDQLDSNASSEQPILSKDQVRDEYQRAQGRCEEKMGQAKVECIESFMHRRDREDASAAWDYQWQEHKEQTKQKEHDE
jgi:hypothetical protein